MPKGIYIRTEKHKEILRKNSPFKKRHKITEKAYKQGKKFGFQKGHPKYGGLKKGFKFSEEYKKKFVSWIKGRKHSEETKRKMSQKRKGRKPYIGKQHTFETKEKIRQSIKNNFNIKKSQFCIGHKFSLEIRKKMSEIRKGKNNPNWRGGLSKRGYPCNFNEELKELIRKRDNYKCQLCGIPQEECLRKLDIHHKDSNKENLNPQNLITLCRSCHLGLEFNKENNNGERFSININTHI